MHASLTLCPFSCERSEGCGGRSDPQDARTRKGKNKPQQRCPEYPGDPLRSPRDACPQSRVLQRCADPFIETTLSPLLHMVGLLARRHVSVVVQSPIYAGCTTPAQFVNWRFDGRPPLSVGAARPTGACARDPTHTAPVCNRAIIPYPSLTDELPSPTPSGSIRRSRHAPSVPAMPQLFRFHMIVSALFPSDGLTRPLPSPGTPDRHSHRIHASRPQKTQTPYCASGLSTDPYLPRAFF